MSAIPKNFDAIEREDSFHFSTLIAMNSILPSVSNLSFQQIFIGEWSTVEKNLPQY